MNKVVRWIINIFLVLVIAVLTGYLVLRLTNKVEIYDVKTGSMEENIHVGDYVLILKISNYNVGDVVTYKKNGYLVTHRIIKKESNTFVTKGDANNAEDEAIDGDSIVGKVYLNGGLLNIVIRYKYVLVALVISLYLISCYFGKEEDLKEEK